MGIAQAGRMSPPRPEQPTGAHGQDGGTYDPSAPALGLSSPRAKRRVAAQQPLARLWVRMWSGSNPREQGRKEPADSLEDGPC
jgi:hypothetical protein